MSQNQFPGQGGPQYPQQGGGQQFPQQGGGQQFPQGGQPYPQQGQPYPQGQPPQGQPPQGPAPQGPAPQGGQPFPQQGQPYPPGGPVPPGGAYPQQGRPYPQQGGGYGPAGQYPPAGASGQYGGGGAQPGYSGGFPPQPPKPKGNGMIIGIVVAGLAVVALAGWLLMSLFGPSGGDPTPSVSPTVSTQTTAPSPQPSTDPSTEPSTDPSPDPSPSTSTSTPPSGGLEVGLGVSVAPADGWKQTSREEMKNYTELSNGKALLATQAFRVEGQVQGKDVVAAYMKQITANMTGVSSKTPSVMDVKNSRLSVGIGSWTGTRATSQGSIKLSYVSIISVRDDGLAVMSTLIVPAPNTVASVQDDYLDMTNSLLNSQLQA